MYLFNVCRWHSGICRGRYIHSSSFTLYTHSYIQSIRGGIHGFFPCCMASCLHLVCLILLTSMIDLVSCSTNSLPIFWKDCFTYISFGMWDQNPKDSVTLGWFTSHWFLLTISSHLAAQCEPTAAVASTCTGPHLHLLHFLNTFLHFFFDNFFFHEIWWLVPFKLNSGIQNQVSVIYSKLSCPFKSK